MSLFEPRLAHRDFFERVSKTVFDFYLAEGIDIPYGGVFQKKFEHDFANLHGISSRGVVCNSGTSAFWAILKSLDLAVGSAVLVSAFNDPGIISVLVSEGLQPVVVDLPSSAGKVWQPHSDYIYALNEIPAEIGCVVVNHATGQSVSDIQAIAELCRQRDIPLVEDCSQIHGGKSMGLMCGTFGDAAFWSLMSRKTICMIGSGGIACAQNPELVDKIRFWVDRGKDFSTSESASNAAMSKFMGLNLTANDLGCAMASEVLTRIHEIIQKRITWIEKLASEISDLDVFKVNYLTEGSSPFLVPLEINAGADSARIERCKVLLKSTGIPMNSNYSYLVNEFGYLKQKVKGSCPAALNFRNSHVMLFIHERYGENELSYVKSQLEKVERLAS